MTAEVLMAWVCNNADNIRAKARLCSPMEKWLQLELADHLFEIGCQPDTEITFRTQGRSKRIDIQYSYNGRVYVLEIKVQHPRIAGQFGGSDLMQSMRWDALRLVEYANTVVQANADSLLMIVTLHEGWLGQVRYDCADRRIPYQSDIAPSVGGQREVGVVIVGAEAVAGS